MRSPPEAAQHLGVPGPQQGLGVAPEVDGLEPELPEETRLSFVEHSPVTRRPEADLGSGPREIHQVHAICAEGAHEAQQERVRVHAVPRQISEVPVRPAVRISPSARAEEDEEPQPPVLLTDPAELLLEGV